MKKSKRRSSAPGTSTRATKDNELLGRLAELWASYQSRGLDVRLQTGVELNKRLGSPTGRQPHGQAILKKVGARLGISESELNRMRWFAHRFVGLADLKAKHPRVDSWTKVKELLVSLNPKKDKGGKEASKTDRRKAAYLANFQRSLKTATQKLGRKGYILSDAEKEAVLKSVQELVAVLQSRHKLRVISA